MSDTEFKILWDTILAVTRMASVIDPAEVRKLIDTANMAASVGPILYPSEYQRGAANVEEQRILAEGFLAFREAIDQVKGQAAK